MAISPTLQKYLTNHVIAYELLPHSHTTNSLNTANSAHIPGANMAKSVIFEDEDGYLMAVVPATEHVKIRELNQALKRNMGLATEMELHYLFKDCEVGAIPPIGPAYGMETVVDESLMLCNDVYFEAGDHEGLVHVEGTSFRKLLRASLHANICIH